MSKKLKYDIITKKKFKLESDNKQEIHDYSSNIDDDHFCEYDDSDDYSYSSSLDDTSWEYRAKTNYSKLDESFKNLQNTLDKLTNSNEKMKNDNKRLFRDKYSTGSLSTTTKYPKPLSYTTKQDSLKKHRVLEDLGYDGKKYIAKKEKETKEKYLNIYQSLLSEKKSRDSKFQKNYKEMTRDFKRHYLSEPLMTRNQDIESRFLIFKNEYSQLFQFLSKMNYKKSYFGKKITLLPNKIEESYLKRSVLDTKNESFIIEYCIMQLNILQLNLPLKIYWKIKKMTSEFEYILIK